MILISLNLRSKYWGSASISFFISNDGGGNTSQSSHED